jgi:CBS domain-containing protein
MLRLRDIMTTDVITVSPELSVRDAMHLLLTRHVTGAPVVAQNRVVGVVSTTDLLAFAADSLVPEPERTADDDWADIDAQTEPVEGDEPSGTWFAELQDPAPADVAQRFDDLASARPHPDGLAQHTVSEIMNHNVCFLTGTTRVDEAADFMRRAAIHRVLVMDGGDLKGIVTLKDIADAVADHKLTAHTYTFGKPSAPSGFRR